MIVPTTRLKDMHREVLKLCSRLGWGVLELEMDDGDAKNKDLGMERDRNKLQGQLFP